MDDIIQSLTPEISSILGHDKALKKVKAMDNVKLDIHKGALERVVELAFARKTGARGLRTIIENAMLPVMYSAPSNKNIQKIVMDVDEKDSLKVVPTVIENPKTTEEVSA